jgi:hypothetical protein
MHDRFGSAQDPSEALSLALEPKSLALRPLIVALFVGIGLGSTAISQVSAPAEKATGKAQQPSDPLTSLNDASRVAYVRAKQIALAHSVPVILIEGDEVVLKTASQRRQVRFIPVIYHALKAISHVPLGIDVTLAAHSEENPLPVEVLNDLREYRGLFPAVLERLATVGLDGEQRNRGKAILDQSSAFLDSVIERRGCTKVDRLIFARRMWPSLMANCADAARAALDSLHRQVCQWKDHMTPAEWNQLSVVVMGRQLPRKENLAVQYFARLLGETGEGRRIVYAESLFDEPRALDLLATRIVDTQIGIDFFNDPLRMHRDLLSDAARDYLTLLIDKH